MGNNEGYQQQQQKVLAGAEDAQQIKTNNLVGGLDMGPLLTNNHKDSKSGGLRNSKQEDRVLALNKKLNKPHSGVGSKAQKNSNISSGAQ